MRDTVPAWVGTQLFFFIGWLAILSYWLAAHVTHELVGQPEKCCLWGQLLIVLTNVTDKRSLILKITFLYSGNRHYKSYVCSETKYPLKANMPTNSKTQILILSKFRKIWVRLLFLNIWWQSNAVKEIFWRKIMKREYCKLNNKSLVSDETGLGSWLCHFLVLLFCFIYILPEPQFSLYRVNIIIFRYCEY